MFQVIYFFNFNPKYPDWMFADDIKSFSIKIDNACFKMVLECP